MCTLIKMRIQWFPGHMTKALRMMEENIKLCDTVIYVIDSRAVYSSINPSFNRIIDGKPVLYVFNKTDIANPLVTSRWIKQFKKENKAVINVIGTNSGTTKNIINSLTLANKEKIDRYMVKGALKTLRCMVIGIPNSGKSTIINSLCGSKKTMTGDKAGVTKGKQWVKISPQIELLDTPGTLCPAFDNEIVGQHLAYIGSINDMIVDFEGLCLDFIAEISKTNPNEFSARYHLENLNLTPIELYEEICKNRGFILRGKEYDYERCANAIIDDFRKGRIGKISLEDITEYV